MKTFNDFFKGRWAGIPCYHIHKINEAIECIKTMEASADLLIVNHPNGYEGVQIYVNARATPNGVAAKGKIYEGKSRSQAIEALKLKL